MNRNVRLGKRLPRLAVADKTGFRNITGNPVRLIDERGIEFYSTHGMPKRVWEFNLPAGVYYVAEGKIKPVLQPVNYPLAKLPPRERDTGCEVKNFEMVFVSNPFTATVVWNERRIYFDHSLINLPLPYLVFIFYHECGHRYYVTEEHCDLFASNMMLKEGYNPTQIGDAIINSLSEHKTGRKLNVVEHLIKN